MEWTMPAFTFPAEAGTHLPTPEWWTAELAGLNCLRNNYIGSHCSVEVQNIFITLHLIYLRQYIPIVSESVSLAEDMTKIFKAWV